MNLKKLRSIYYKFPYIIKVVAASIHGVSLNRIRYGKHYIKEKDDAKVREKYTQELIMDFQKSNLKNILSLSLLNVPWYKKNVSIQPSDIHKENVYQKLREFPILEKEALRSDPFAFINSLYSVDKLIEENTSGTTGTPLRLFRTKRMSERWYAIAHLRWLSWAGFSDKDRWVIFGGQLVADVRRNKPPYWVENISMKQLYFSVYHISKNTVSDYLEKLASYNPKYIWTYPSALMSIVTLAEELKILWSGPAIDGVIGNGEPFFKIQRERIENFFSTKTIDTYGASEGVFMGSECREGNLHLSPDVGHCEVLDENNNPVQNGVAGHFICTGFLNEAMPLIRYRTGDIVTLAKDRCKCGLNFPVIKEIVGRMDDTIILPDGRSVGRMDPILKVEYPIKEVQFVQTKLDQVVVKVVPAIGFGEETIGDLEQAIRMRLGDQIKITIKEIDSIPLTSAGKFKSVVSEINL